MSAVAGAVAAPYKGLSPFDDSEQDALLFFGRERETQIVAANALASRLTVLYGPTGVGKSSLLRAGVVRSLRELAETESIAVAYFSSWSDDPVEGIEEAARTALAAAFGGDPGDAPGDLPERLDAWTAALGTSLCIVLDQFEELFVYRGAEELVDVLPDLVTRPGLRVNVVLGIRDDELAKLDAFKARIPGLFSNYLRLDLLDRDAGRAAILGPLDRYTELQGERVTIEPELVERVLDEVAAGRLGPAMSGRGAVADGSDGRARVETPYLQLVMQRLWEVERERGSSELRLATLKQLGGAQRIVEDHLEHAMEALTPEQRDVAAGMFDHLVTPSGAKIAHGVSDLASFARVERAEVEPVLSSLARERILRPTGENGHAGDRYEIYHDVLAGAVLAWRARHEAEATLVRERFEARRRQRRLAIVAGIAVIAFGVMAALALYAHGTSRRAHAGELLQRSQAELAIDPALSVRDALQSARIHTSSRSEDALRTALLKLNALATLRARGEASAAAYSPDGKRIAVSDRAGSLRVFRMASGAPVATFRAGVPLNDVAWSADGRRVAVAARDGRVRVWDVVGGQTAHRSETITALAGPLRTVAYAHSGRELLIAGNRGALLWDAASHRVVRRLTREIAGRGAIFSPNGALVATRDEPGVVRVFDAAHGQRLATLRQRAGITSLAFGGDSKSIVTGSRDGTAEIWNARTGAPQAGLLGHSTNVLAVAFCPHGDLVATGSADGTARVWTTRGRLIDVIRGASASVTSVAFAPDCSYDAGDATTTASYTLVVGSSDGTAQTVGNGTQPQQLLGQGAPMHAATFAPDGTTVATIAGSTVRVWEPYGEPRLEPLLATKRHLTSLAFDPSGDALAVGTDRGALVLRHVGRGESVRTVATGRAVVGTAWAPDGELMLAQEHGGVRLLANGDPARARTVAAGATLVAAALRADGDVVATADTTGVVRLWDAADGTQLRALRATDGVTCVALDPPGRLVAVGAGDVVRVYDARTGALRKVLTGHTDDVTAVAFSADGRFLASSSKDHDARLWDAGTLRPVKVLHRHAAFVSGIAFTSDSRWLATAGPTKAGVWATSDSDLPGSFLFFARGNVQPIAAVAFSPRGWELATASRDGTVRTLECHLCGGLAELETYARSRLAAVDR